jgi:hypothetical protein
MNQKWTTIHQKCVHTGYTGLHRYATGRLGGDLVASGRGFRYKAALTCRGAR